MTFQDAQKQAEFDALANFCKILSQRPYAALKRTAINQLQSFVVGQYGGSAQREVVAIFSAQNSAAKVEQPKERVLLGKARGDASARRNSSPVAPKQPAPGSEREKRLRGRGVLPESRSEVHEVVVGGETASGLTKKLKRRAKEIADVGLRADELLSVQLSTGATFDTGTGRTENDPLADAPILSAKELVEKYGRDLIFESVVDTYENLEELEQKTDRQLANLLKRKVAE